MTEAVFRFLPGEKVEWIVGMPGPDLDNCEILQDDGGDDVLIRFQVYGQGEFHERWTPRKIIVMRRGSATFERYQEWKACN